MKIFIADSYYKDIYSINYDALKKEGIKYLLFDIDNTLCPPHDDEFFAETKKLFVNLKKKDFTIYLITNNNKKRLSKFENYYKVKGFAHMRKPFKSKYIKLFNKYSIDVDATACIGDQLLTDVLGGKKLGIKTVLVDPISKDDAINTLPNRFIEKYIYKYFEKKKLFKKGSYYE